MVIQIYKGITNAISRGILKPGQVLKEQELQRWFGVSRAPVREAIRLLEGDGILIVNSYKKKYIRHITRQDFKDISLLLACIEGFAASLASKTITANQIADLQRINREFENAFDQKKFDLTAELNLQFHKYILELANNKILTEAIRPVTKMTRYWLTCTSYQNASLVFASIKEHKKIIEILRIHDSSKAEEEVRKHILNAYDRLLKYSIFDSDGKLVIPS